MYKIRCCIGKCFEVNKAYERTQSAMKYFNKMTHSGVYDLVELYENGKLLMTWKPKGEQK